MPEVTIVYWRDIPAQVIVGKGRRGSKRALPERFEQAIDRAAMKVGAEDPMPIWRNGARPTLTLSRVNRMPLPMPKPPALMPNTTATASRR